MALKTMYPAKNNSPATLLSVACTATATSIVLENASVLPEAPNLAVLGSDETAEIIRYNAIDSNILSGVERGINGTTAKAWSAGTNVARNFTSYDHDTFIENIESIDGDLTNVQEDVADINTRMVQVENDIADLEAQMAFKRYGVSGIGLQSATLTRLYDAVGMTAEVGTDDSSATVTNDFDSAAPFMHRKCVGHWEKEDGHAKFVVQAYYGDSNYSEDGTMGDYVAVELPLSFYYLDGSTLVISAHKYDGYRPFDIFCRNHNENDLIDKVYVPAYALALDDDGHAVSLPNLDNEQGDYAALFTKARNYNNDELSGFGMLMPASLQFYYWALMNVEFATQNCQSIMQGCVSLRHSNDDTCKFLDATHVLVGNWQTARVVGEYVAIIDTTVDQNNVNYKASHRIISITRADATGAASDSGTYTNVEVEDLGKGYYDYDTSGETTYRFVARPYRTGACNNVITPSGSPVSNANGYYPMRYRYRENVYGNQYQTSVDLFNVRQGSNDNDYYLEWFYLSNPTAIVIPTNPDKTALSKAPYIKLSLITPHENYTNAYIISKQYDETYPDIWTPLLIGGASSTYYCDNSTIVSTAVARSYRFGGHWHSGALAGLSFVYANNAPSSVSAYYGGALFFPQ